MRPTDRRDEFQRLILPVLDALFRTARRLTGDHRHAEDLVSETCLRGLRFFDRFAPGTRFKAWIFQILRNTFISEVRRRAREEPLAPVDPAVLPDLSAGSDGAAAVDGRSARGRAAILDAVDDDIRRALDSLPEDHRMIVMLSVFEGLKYREIAEIMDCPIGTVMSRLFRARRALQDLLLEYARARGIAAG